MKRRARRVGPATSRIAASMMQSSNIKEVYRVLKKSDGLSCEQVIFILKENLPPGKTLREDPISGMFNELCQKGLIVPTGQKHINTSGAPAIIWRVATKKERRYIKEFIGYEDPPFPAADKLLQESRVKELLLNHPNKRVRHEYRLYNKGVLFRTKFKDKGIQWLMRNYDANGKRKVSE